MDDEVKRTFWRVQERLNCLEETLGTLIMYLARELGQDAVVELLEKLKGE